MITTLKKYWFTLFTTTAVIVFLVAIFLPEVTFALEEPIPSDVLCKAKSPWLEPILGLLGDLLLMIAGWFAYLTMAGGYILDVAMKTSLDSNSINGLAIVNQGWDTSRDLANMVFIFVLLYIAIGTILRLGNVQWKKALAHLIVVALLINFSLFFTKVIIDASNVLAVFFYNRIVTEVNLPAGEYESHDPGYIIAQGFKIQSQYNESEAGLCGSQKIMSGIGAIFLNILTTFFMIVCALLFVMRTVAFILLLMTAPLAYVAMIVPRTQSFASQWWSKLLNYALVGPLMTIGLFFLAKLVNEGNLGALTNSDDANFGKAATGSVSDMTIFFRYATMAGFMFALLGAVQSVGGSLANKAVSWAKKGVGTAIGVGAITGAYVGSKTIGAGARVVARSDWLAQKQNSDSRIGRAASRMTLKAANYTQNASFDARNSKLGKAGIATVNAGIGAYGQGGIDTGQGSKTTAKSRFDTKVASKQSKKDAYLDQISTDKDGNVRTTKDKDGNITTLRKIEIDRQKKLAEGDMDLGDSRLGRVAQKVVTKAVPTQTHQVAAGKTAGKYKEMTSAEHEAIAKAELKDLKSSFESPDKPNPSEAQISTKLRKMRGSSLTKADPDLVTRKEVARNLTLDQVKAIGRSEDWTPEDKEKIRDIFQEQFDIANRTESRTAEIPDPATGRPTEVAVGPGFDLTPEQKRIKKQMENSNIAPLI